MADMNIISEQWDLARVFTISRQSRTVQDIILVEIRDGGLLGRGEGIPVDYAGESVASVTAQLEAVRHKIRDGMTPQEAQVLLPHGAARNALDCALWDLEARRRGEPAWKLARLETFKPLETAYTLSIDSPDAMKRAAAENAALPLLKIKLKGDGADLERMQAIREGAPRARLIIDANEGWSETQLDEYIPPLHRLGVELIEQPVPAGSDRLLEDFRSAIPLCADESCSDAASLDHIANKYQFINIKLDKSGGLTEALKLAREARERGLRLMVGCMCGTSLGMAPAAIIGQLCEFVDLDGPLLLRDDRRGGIAYENGVMTLPEQGLWG